MLTSIALLIFSPIVKMLGISGIIAAICIALAVFEPAWFPLSRQRLLEVAAVALFCGFYSLYWFSQGETYMTSKIAAKDKAAIDHVVKALKEVQACEDSGGTWNVEDGSCSR